MSDFIFSLVGTLLVGVMIYKIGGYIFGKLLETNIDLDVEIDFE